MIQITSLIRFEIFEDNLANHEISVSEIEDNSLRVIVYSFSNDIIGVGDFSFIKLSFNVGGAQYI